MEINKSKLKLAIQDIVDDVDCKEIQSCDFQEALCEVQQMSMTFPFPSIPLQRGDISSFPISQEDLLRMKEEAIEQSKVNLNRVENDARPLRLHIQETSLLRTERGYKDLALKAVNRLAGFPLVDECDFSVTMNHIVVCADGQWLSDVDFDYSQKPGCIGKLILQIPVTGQSTEVKLTTKKDRNTFTCDVKLQNKWFYMIFISEFSYEFRPFKNDGAMVALGFNLIWRPTSVHPSPNITYSFLRKISAFKVTKGLLSSWENVHFEKSKSFNPTPQRRNKGKKFKSSNSSETGNQILVFPLVEAYDSSFNNKSLRADDLQLAAVFRSIDFLDVHLAVLTQTSEMSFSIDKWIYFNRSLPQLEKLELNVSHFVSKSKTVLQSDSTKKEYPVLIIQPRRHSFYRCALRNFNGLLDHLAHSVGEGSDSKSARLYCTSFFKDVMAFCEKEAWIVWDHSLAEDNTTKMLKICQKLFGLESANRLLDVLAKIHRRDDDGNAEELYVGIRSSSIARAITDLVVSATDDWSVIERHVLGLINPSGLLEQLPHICSLASCLLDDRFYSGAIAVVGQIFSTISSNLEYFVGAFEQSSIDTYFDTVATLMDIPERIRAEKSVSIESLILPIFVNLNPVQQFNVLISLKRKESRLKHQICLYEKMALHVLDHRFSSSLQASDLMKEVVLCLLQENNNRLLEALVDRVLWQTDGSDFSFTAWFLETILEVNKDFSTPKAAIITSVESHLISLARIEMGDVKSSILRSFFVVGTMERHVWIADSCKSLKTLSPLYRRLPAPQLNSILSDLILCIENFRLMNSTFVRAELHSIRSVLFDQDVETIDTKPLVDLLRLFLRLDEVEPAQNFIDDLCGLEKWGHRQKTDLIRFILSSPEIWKDKKEDVKFVGVNMSKLTGCWIEELNQMIDIIEEDEEERTGNRTNIAACFHLFVRQEQNPHIFPAQSNLEAFIRLLDKMSVNHVGHLLLDYLATCQSEEHWQLLKTLPSIFHLCHRFVKSDLKDWLSTIEDQHLIRVTKCLLVLEDDSIIAAYANHILAAFSENQPNKLIPVIIQSPDVRDSMATSTSWARQLCERRLSVVTDLIEKGAPTPSSWRMDYLSIPGHPAVEKFLHSEQRERPYANFSTTEEAELCKSEILNLICRQGLGLQVTVKGSGYNATCEIVKIKSDIPDSSISIECLIQEKRTLESLIQIIQPNGSELLGEDSNSLAPKRRTSDCDTFSYAKKMKSDMEVIEIDDESS